MAVLNYRLVPGWPDEDRPGPRQRGRKRTRIRRQRRRCAKRLDERLWRRAAGR